MLAVTQTRLSRLVPLERISVMSPFPPPEGDHYHARANPAKGETPGERGGQAAETDRLPTGKEVAETATREEAVS
jgi:hypothetical protein